MPEILSFSIRCIETVLGISGLIISLSKLKGKMKTFIFIYIIVVFLGISLVVTSFVLYGPELAAKLFIPLIFIASIVCLSLCNADSFYVSSFNLFTQLTVYLGVSFFAKLVTRNIVGDNYFILYLIVRAIVFSILILFYIKYVRKEFRHAVVIIDKEWKIFCIISIVFFVQQIFLGIYPVMYDMRPDYIYINIAMSYVIWALIYYIIYKILNSVINNYEKRHQENFTIEKIRFLEEQINLQSQSMNNIKRQRHDLRHHCVTAIGFIREEKYNDSIRYLEQYCDNLAEVKFTYYCEHSAINCILSYMAEKAKAVGIMVEINASIPNDLSADEIEIASLCANSFENAFEGCQRVPQEIVKEIFIILKYNDNRLLMEIKNTCLNDIDFDGEFPISKKEHGGIGTKSIAYVAEKYHGMVYFNVKDDIFTTRIILNI